MNIFTGYKQTQTLPPKDLPIRSKSITKKQELRSFKVSKLTI